MSTNNRIFFRLHGNNSFHDFRIYYNQSFKILLSNRKIKFIYDAYTDSNLRIPGTNENNSARQGILSENDIIEDININTNIINIERKKINVNNLRSLKSLIFTIQVPS